MQADTLEILAGELIAAIRINTMRGTFAKATIEEVDEWLKPWIGRLDALRPTDHIRGVTKLIREEPNVNMLPLAAQPEKNDDKE